MEKENQIDELLDQLKKERKDNHLSQSAIKLILQKLHELRDDQLETNVNESSGCFYSEKIGKQKVIDDREERKRIKKSHNF